MNDMHFGRMQETGDGWTEAGLRAACSCGWVAEESHAMTSLDSGDYQADYASYLVAFDAANADFKAHPMSITTPFMLVDRAS